MAEKNVTALLLTDGAGDALPQANAGQRRRFGSCRPLKSGPLT
jgi:hypothetical protein